MTATGPKTHQSIEAAYTAACQQWPDIKLSPQVFGEYVRERSAPGQQLAELCWTDLYLACACAQGFPQALEAFEREHMPRVESAIRRMSSGLQLSEETKQRLREMLFVGCDDRRPAIRDYSGRGPLRSWVRVIAVREAMRLMRRHKGEVQVEDERLFDAFTPVADPELSYIKDRAVTEFRRAFLDAIGELSRRERTVLRLSVLDGLSIDEIAPMYQVHRATVARWLERVRKTILHGTRQRLRHQLELGDTEVDSLIRVAQSRIDLTLGSALDSRE